MEKKGNISDRDIRMDVVKGIGIILVVIGHAKRSTLLGKMIYGFHMPLFFILAGMFYHKEKWEKLGVEELIRSRAKSYLIPYFTMASINLVLNAIDEIAVCDNFSNWVDTQVYHVGWIVYATGLSKLSPNCSPLWFLPCLFLSYVIFYFVVRLKMGNQIGVCVMLVALNKMVFMVLPKITPKVLPWHIDTALVGAVLMVVGYQIKMRGWHKLIEKNIFIFLLLVGVGGVAGWMNLGKVAFASNRVGNPIFMMFYSCATTLVLISVGGKIGSTIIGRFLAFCGKSTMIFMGFNYYFNRHTKRMWKMLPILNEMEYHWILKVVVVTMCLSFTSYIWKVVKNSPEWSKKLVKEE